MEDSIIIGGCFHLICCCTCDVFAGSDFTCYAFRQERFSRDAIWFCFLDLDRWLLPCSIAYKVYCADRIAQKKSIALTVYGTKTGFSYATNVTEIFVMEVIP